MNEKTAIDPLIGQPVFGMNLVAVPPPSVRDMLFDVQQAIESRMPPGLFFRCEPATLHMSVLQLVPSRSVSPGEDRGMWERHAGEAIASLEVECASTTAMMLGSAAIQANASAVILRFGTSQALEQLRDRLVGSLTHWLPCLNRPNIQHVTLFRFHQVFSLQHVRDACERARLSGLRWEIDSLQLIVESVYPFLEVRLEADCPLRGH